MAKGEPKVTLSCEQCGQQVSVPQLQQVRSEALRRIEEAQRLAEEKIKHAEQEVLELMRQRARLEDEVRALRRTVSDLGGSGPQPSAPKRKGWLRRG